MDPSAPLGRPAGAAEGRQSSVERVASHGGLPRIGSTESQQQNGSTGDHPRRRLPAKQTSRSFSDLSRCAAESACFLHTMKLRWSGAACAPAFVGYSRIQPRGSQASQRHCKDVSVKAFGDTWRCQGQSPRCRLGEARSSLLLLVNCSGQSCDFPCFISAKPRHSKRVRLLFKVAQRAATWRATRVDRCERCDRLACSCLSKRGAASLVGGRACSGSGTFVIRRHSTRSTVYIAGTAGPQV